MEKNHLFVMVHTAIIYHVSTPVDHHVNVVQIVQRLRALPDHCERRRYIRSFLHELEFHRLAVNGVIGEVRVHAGHPSFDVELAQEPDLRNGGPAYMNFHAYALLCACGH